MIPLALIQQIQIDFLKRISLLLERGKVDVKTSKQWGRELLALLPFTSLDDLKQKITSFSQTHPLLENLTLSIKQFEDHIKTMQTAKQMEDLIKNKKTEEALQLVK